MNKKFYSTSEVGEILEVNRYTVSLWVNRGTLKAMVTPGGHRKVPREELARFIQNRGGVLPPELRMENRKRIFVVDDEPGVLRIYGRLIRVNIPGADIEEFSHPVGALLTMGKSPPDLILLDIVAPDIDGFSVCRRIRENETMSAVRIIAMSGDDDNLVARKSREAGADDFYYKGDPAQDLVAKVSNILKMELVRKPAS